MSDQVGVSQSAGTVRVPATFHGTARLLDGNETPPAPVQGRHDDLPAAFHADVHLDFDMLRSLGFEPVAPTHPAYPHFLAASAASAAPTPSTASRPSSGLDPHGPHALRLPFTATITITADAALQHGLVAPGSATAGPSQPSRAQQTAPVRRKPAPPPYAPTSGTLAQPKGSPPPAHPSGLPPIVFGTKPSAPPAGSPSGKSPPIGNVGVSPGGTAGPGGAGTAPSASPVVMAAMPSTIMASASGMAVPVTGTLAASGAGAVAEGLAAAGEVVAGVGGAVLSSGALFMAPAAVMLWPSSTASDDTVLSRGMPIGGWPVGGTGVGNGADSTVNVGDLNTDLHLGANRFTPVPSLASGSPPLLPPETGPVQESLPIATGGSRQEGLTPPLPVAPLPGLTPPDMSVSTRPEGFTPISLEARKPLGPEVRLVNGRAPLNARDYTGQNFPAGNLPPGLQTKYPAGVNSTPQGFPDFGPHVLISTEVPDLTGDRERDERLANISIGAKKTPKGYTWHHVEDGVTMQLVPTDLHRIVSHSGGVAIKKGEKNGA